MNKYVTGKAKVLKANADGAYELGFRCPDCESGWITMQYTCTEKLTEGSLIDVKIGKITKDNGLMIEQYIEEAPDADWMPALMILAREIDIINDVTLAGWTTAFINELPDSAFAYVEPCYGKTNDNKNARHLPYKGKDGAVDLPHLRNALARVNQIKLICSGDTAAAITSATRTLEAAAKRAGIGKYKVREKLMNQFYKLQDAETLSMVVGLSQKELAVDTLASADDFVSVIPGNQMIDFTLIHHWWGNGEEFDHYDLFLGTDPQTHIVLGKNPLKDTEFKAAQRKSYTEDFWKRGENTEQIGPNEPGNPSDVACSVQRVDMGKVAVYENALQGNGTWSARMEFFGTKLEGRWTFMSSVPYIWNVTKETTKLTEQFSMQLAMSGGIGGWKETPDGLMVEGKALSYGVWNGMFWGPEVIMQSPVDDFDNLIIDVEHKRDKVAGKVIEKAMTGADINVKFLVTDYETAEKIKSGEYKGLSIDAMVMGDPVRRVITQVKQYSRLTVCKNPACQVCTIGNCAI